jgi:hypothetical protein
LEFFGESLGSPSLYKAFSFGASPLEKGVLRGGRFKTKTRLAIANGGFSMDGKACKNRLNRENRLVPFG